MLNMKNEANNKDTLLIDFQLTQKCNYRCSYCDQGVNKAGYKHADDEVCDRLCAFLKSYPKTVKLQLVGGEPTVHRRFLELVKVAVDNGHYIQTCTNFSKPLDFWDKFVSMAKDRLCKLQISYHPTQIKDKDEFISKIKNITKALSKNTEFILSAVLSDENYDDIIRLQKELKGTAIELELQHLRELDGSYVKYSPKLQNLLESCAKVEGLDKVSNNKSFGILCSTGKNFFTIGITGDIGRCYRMNDLYHLGNITEKLYLYKTKLPCIAKQCNCTLPYTHGCLDFSHKMPLFAKFLLKFAKYNFIKRLLQKKVALNDFTKGQK